MSNTSTTDTSSLSAATNLDNAGADTSSTPVTTSNSGLSHTSAKVNLQRFNASGLQNQGDLPMQNSQFPILQPCHPMVTRSKARIYKKKVFVAVIEPVSAKVALSVPEWKYDMVEEYKALNRNHTWTLVKLPPHRTPIGYKWVLKVKDNAYGTVNRYKARLVAKRFHQTHGFDFT